MDRPVDTTPASERRVGRIHDRIDLLGGDVAMEGS
jgi:hypothetical protein